MRCAAVVGVARVPWHRGLVRGSGGQSPRIALIALGFPLALRSNYALKRTVRDEVSGAIMHCGPHGRLA
jgi:hypothetical protein